MFTNARLFTKKSLLTPGLTVLFMSTVYVHIAMIYYVVIILHSNEISSKNLSVDNYY